MPATPAETFFRPEERARERLTIPAVLYNLCRLVLGRSDGEHVFVPVRSMQFQAVIGRDEVIFVDSQDYAVQDGEGGRLICLAWVFRHDAGRDDLTEPAPIELVYFREDTRELHGRLVGEFGRALRRCAAELPGRVAESHCARILTFRR